MARYLFVFLSLVVVVAHAEYSNNNCGCNEEINICGRLCEPTCSNGVSHPLICPKIPCNILTKGCRCKKGFYRDNVTKRCILPGECPVPTTTTTPCPCGENEQYGNCGRICEKKCSNSSLAQCAATSCSGYGCQCLPGYFRNELTDKCVKECDCPKKCGKGEILDWCGKKCESTCDCPSPPEICSRIKCSTKGCRCDLASGYVRDKTTNKCIQIKQCPLVCPANSAPKLCGRFCEPTCRNPGTRLCKIDPSQCRVDCRCLDGFVRDEQTNQCVKPSSCNKCD